MEEALNAVDRITRPVGPFLSAPSLDLIFHASPMGGIHRVAKVAETETMPAQQLGLSLTKVELDTSAAERLH